MLIAVLVGSAVVAASATIAVQSAQARKQVRLTLEERAARAFALDMFERDLNGRLRDLPRDVPPVQPGAEPGRIEILCLVDSPRVGSWFSRRLPARVGYLIESDPSAGMRLTREVRLLTDPPERAQRREIAFGLHEARIEFWTADAWTDLVALRGERKQMPGAVRLTCAWDGGLDRHSRTVVLDELAEAGKP